MKTLFIVHDDCSDDQARRSPNLVRTLFFVLLYTISNRYVDYCCSFGCSTPGSAPALSVQHSRSRLPVTGHPLHITHCPFLMLVTFRCMGVRMGPNTLHSRSYSVSANIVIPGK